MDFCISAGDVGHAKPHPAPFEYAIEHCAVPAAENILHVGDDYVADCVGAKRLGLHTVWITDSKLDFLTHPDADVAMAHVRGLLDLFSHSRSFPPHPEDAARNKI